MRGNDLRSRTLNGGGSLCRKHVTERWFLRSRLCSFASTLSRSADFVRSRKPRSRFISEPVINTRVRKRFRRRLRRSRTDSTRSPSGHQLYLQALGRDQTPSFLRASLGCQEREFSKTCRVQGVQNAHDGGVGGASVGLNVKNLRTSIGDSTLDLLWQDSDTRSVGTEEYVAVASDSHHECVF